MNRQSIIDEINRITPEEEQKQEASIVGQILNPYTSQIIEIREYYKILIEIVTNFLSFFPQNHQELNKLYVEFFKLVENNIEIINCSLEDNKIFDELNYFNNSKLFNNFFRPFENLYIAETDLKQKHDDLKSILERMRYFYGQVEYIIDKFIDKDYRENITVDLVEKAHKLLKNIEEKNEQINYDKSTSTSDKTKFEFPSIDLGHGWKLIEEGLLAYLRYRNKTLYDFNVGTLKYKYFKYICQNIGRRLAYKEVFLAVNPRYSDKKLAGITHKDMKKHIYNLMNEIHSDKIHKIKLSVEDKRLLSKIRITYQRAFILKIIA